MTWVRILMGANFRLGKTKKVRGRAITNSWLLLWICKLEDAACEGGWVPRDWRYRTDEVSSALANSSNTFKGIKVATAMYLSCKETTISIDDDVKKVEIVAGQPGCGASTDHPICVIVSMHDTVIVRIKESSAPLTSC
ncbi:hypothetical protein SEVIR_8G104050v4 [Setaria viridis]